MCMSHEGTVCGNPRLLDRGRQGWLLGAGDPHLLLFCLTQFMAFQGELHSFPPPQRADWVCHDNAWRAKATGRLTIQSLAWAGTAWDKGDISQSTMNPAGASVFS